ncbi:hypothetical protein P691DRAFT_764611 [Macrolepiota fuliginosa MF-IS2]|uniref:Uncharacterized protein n=1 Tax=Macrolepiota fuliginosa MF-IS2 TaxID=1400762 RepID=A0A9P5X1H9_9AGAR|nr:hypothetical protein P691DRAFT_764611 [Macrolepiota fuliginosa MF-IS2]
MARKPKTKASASDTKLSDTTVTFLNAQNQDLHTKSIVQMLLLITLPKLVQVQVQHELDTISFTYKAPALPLPPPETPKEEEDSTDNKMDIHLYNDALHSLILWMANEGFNNEADFNAQNTMVKCIHVLACELNVVKVITPPTPTPPPPCTQPHSNNKDICMEPPAPAHMFSEAATQTPAPLPMATTPPPPPPPMTSALAASTSSKPGPMPRPSFAEAAVKTLCPTAPPFVQGPPCAPQPPPKAPQGPVLSKCSKQPYFTT